LTGASSVRAALFQMTAGIDPQANAAALVAAAGEARAAGADMLFTPEMSGCLDRDRARSATVIRVEIEDPVLTGVQAAAREHGLWVQLGSLAIADEASGKRRNRAFLIDDQGEIRARYDKMHLFDVDLPSGESWRESNSYVAGETSVLASTPWGRLGLTICYDLRFPDLYRALSDAGADMVSVPAAFTVPTGEAHWHVLLRARAIEGAMFVIAAAQVGRHEDGRETYGHSLVIDPWGTVLLDAGREPGLYLVDLPLARIGEVRARIPALRHRKPVGAVVTS
jgi:predicted amidohydrolase